MVPTSSRALFLAVIAVAASLLVACGAANNDLTPVATRTYNGQPRPFLMGISSLPVQLDEGAYRKAFAVAGQTGELILVQRPPAWEEFTEGGTTSSETNATTQGEKTLAAENGLQFMVAIDVLDPSTRSAVAVPEAWPERSFADEVVREAYLGYVEYMAKNYQPRYMALAVEVNLLYEQDREEFEAFLPVYREAYDRVKRASPDTSAFVSFQYEELLGKVPWKKEHEPRWELMTLFDPQLDAFAISTYPSFVYPSVEDVPVDYYTQIRDHTTLPVVIAEAGFSSATGPDGVNSGTEGDQARFVTALLADAEAIYASAVIWFAGADPLFTSDLPIDLFRSIGLWRSDGTPKLAVGSWQAVASRPPPPNTAAQ